MDSFNRMKTRSSNLTRREFLKTTTTATAAAALAPTLLPSVARADDKPASKMIGIQVGAVSFLDEGTEQVLDVLQARGAVNTLFVAAFTYGRGIGGRQVPGQPFPDHGKQESDEKTFHGGNYATPHAKFYEHTTLKETKAPDHGDYDVLADVLPKAHKRGMKVYAWYEDNFARRFRALNNCMKWTFKAGPRTRFVRCSPTIASFLSG